MKMRIIYGFALVLALFVLGGGIAGATTTGQFRLGYLGGDDWEPAITVDSNGNTYVLITHYGGVSDCTTCSPVIQLQVRNGTTGVWSAPKSMTPGNYGSGQFDPQIVVDPFDGKTLYASWLQNNKSSVVVSRSTDGGNIWSPPVVADSTNAGTDKPVLAVRSGKVYVGYNKAQKVYVAVSNDGGYTFTSYQVRQNAQLGWSLASSAVASHDGKTIYFSWAGYTQNGQAKGPVNLYVGKSTDGGQNWSPTFNTVSAAPQTCSSGSKCGWAYLAPQIVVAEDGVNSGTLYALYNFGTVAGGPEQIYFAKSTDGGNSWSSGMPVSPAPPGTYRAFPAIITSRVAGDVRIAWMDNRNYPMWNVYLLESTNGGSTWSSEVKLSSSVSGFSYINANGFAFPYGDYFQLAVDPSGNTQSAWGEGPNYTGPGNIWYALSTP